MAKFGGLKHPTSSSAKHLPHLSKIHKAGKKGLVETPMTSLGKMGGGKHK